MAMDAGSLLMQHGMSEAAMKLRRRRNGTRFNTAWAQEHYCPYEVSSAPPSAWRVFGTAIEIGIVVDPDNLEEVQEMIEEYGGRFGANSSVGLGQLHREKSQ